MLIVPPYMCTQALILGSPGLVLFFDNGIEHVSIVSKNIDDTYTRTQPGIRGTH